MVLPGVIMRAAWMLMLAGCTELDPMPQVAPPPEWTCEGDFEELWGECDAHDDCAGLMRMDSLVDASPMAMASRRIDAQRFNESDGTLERVDIHLVTQYFRGTVRIDSIDLAAGESARAFRVFPGESADEEANAVRFAWSISNTDVPATTRGYTGLVRVDDLGNAVLATWLVYDEAGEFIEGCAYARTDAI